MGNIISSFEMGTPVMLLGMGVVFLVLMLLWGVLELFRVLFYDMPRRKEAAKPAVAAPAAAAPQSAQPITEDQEELIAISSAAIATTLGKPANSLRIHSIRRL
jgi:sodium pump decarboxylase gamma subunit